jgi:[ribosomal protein S5]-alanine N-acetyltransferase
MTLRPLTPEDADELAQLLVENREFLAPFDPIRDARYFTVEGQRERIQNEPGHAFAIVDGERIAGVMALSNVVYAALRSANLGYWVAERHGGRGLATRAVGEIVEIAFGQLGLHRIEAGTLVDNVASQRVLEKNGFEQIGLARRYLLIAGEWRDHLLFQRTAD